MVYINGKYVERKELVKIFETQNTNKYLTFSTFYCRIQGMGWPIDKALSHPVKWLPQNKVKRDKK